MYEVLQNSFNESNWIPVPGDYENFNGYYNLEYVEEVLNGIIYECSLFNFSNFTEFEIF